MAKMTARAGVAKKIVASAGGIISKTLTVPVASAV